MTASKSPYQLLNQGLSHLKPILDRAMVLNQLTAILRDAVDAEFAPHLTLANLRDHTAVIAVDSSVWLGRIRYLAPVFLSTLQQQGLHNISKIQFKVQLADPSLTDASSRQAIGLSARDAETLRSTASGLKHPDLAAALQRLSRHSK